MLTVIDRFSLSKVAVEPAGEEGAGLVERKVVSGIALGSFWVDSSWVGTRGVWRRVRRVDAKESMARIREIEREGSLGEGRGGKRVL